MISDQQLQQVLQDTLAWSKSQQWKGWNKHDGLNSPVLRTLLGNWGEHAGRWPRMVAIQGVMRFPINLRGLLLTPKTYNPKGLALFTHACLDLYRATGDETYMRDARDLLNLLLHIRAPDMLGIHWRGDCWGYAYNWQDPGFNAPPHMPNAVVTSFVCEAFLEAWRISGEEIWLDTVASALEFLHGDLPVLHESADELCLGYMPVPMDLRVMDVSILIASVTAGFNQVSAEPRYADRAQRLYNYVINQQTDYGAWWYTDPPHASRIRHDNYHTGFILDAMHRYMGATGDFSSKAVYDHGLKFYARELFNGDGAPRWMSDQDWPHDIHGAADGILTFSRHNADYPGLADKIATWAINHMYHPDGRFYYQQTRYFTKRFTLLRWCNGWMSRALAALVLSRQQN